MALPLREREQRERFRHQAKRLADTGRHKNWKAVEVALSGDEHGVRRALASSVVRLALDARCAIAKFKHHTS